MIFLLLLGIAFGLLQLWYAIMAYGMIRTGKYTKVTIGLWPGLLAVVLIGAYFLLA